MSEHKAIRESTSFENTESKDKTFGFIFLMNPAPIIDFYSKSFFSLFNFDKSYSAFT